MDKIEPFVSVEEAERVLFHGYIKPLLNPGLFVARDEVEQLHAFQVSLETIRVLFAARDICHGTTEDMLNGKPLPGAWSDGTDAACPGWWRGHDQAAEHYKARIEELEALHRGSCISIHSYTQDIAVLQAKIADLVAENARLRRDNEMLWAGFHNDSGGIDWCEANDPQSEPGLAREDKSVVDRWNEKREP